MDTCYYQRLPHYGSATSTLKIILIILIIILQKIPFTGQKGCFEKFAREIYISSHTLQFVAFT